MFGRRGGGHRHRGRRRHGRHRRRNGGRTRWRKNTIVLYSISVLTFFQRGGLMRALWGAAAEVKDYLVGERF